VPGAGTRYPDLCRTRIPHAFLVGMVGAFAPKGTPKDIIGKLNAAAVAALADPAVRSRLADLGEEVFPPEQQTPEALGALVKADAEKWWPIIKEARIKAERTEATQDVHSLPRPFARYGHAGGSSPFPVASVADWRARAEHQRIGCGAALLLHRDA
jgi:hypothetical protein